MKSLAALFMGALLLSATVASAQSATLTVRVSGPELDRGQVLVAVFDSEASYMKAPAAKAIATLDRAGVAVASFKALAAGLYAVTVIHDLNRNGELDTGLFGIPKEPFGFSNNAKGRFGPAKWRAAQFAVEAPTAKQVISLGRAER